MTLRHFKHQPFRGAVMLNTIVSSWYGNAPSSFLLALPSGQNEGRLGETPAAHAAVWPRGRVRLRGPFSRLRLQTPLERRADGTGSGGPGRSAGGECAGRGPSGVGGHVAQQGNTPL